MQRSAKIALIASLVVVFGGGFAFYWFALRDTAPEEASLRTREPAATSTTSGDDGSSDDDGATGADPATADGEWVVLADDPELVFVGYRVLELFAGDTIEKEAAGRTPDVEGSLTVEGTLVSSAELRADLTGLRTDSSIRDGIVADSVLETDQFPEATFVLTEPIDLDTPPVEGAEVFAPATGDLTIHGVTNEVTFQLTARWDGDTIDVAGSAPVVFADFDVTPPDRPSVAVDDEGTIELQLTFVRA